MEVSINWVMMRGFGSLFLYFRTGMRNSLVRLILTPYTRNVENSSKIPLTKTYQKEKKLHALKMAKMCSIRLKAKTSRQMF